MISQGYTCSYSDDVVLGQPFQAQDGNSVALFNVVSTWLSVVNGGAIVYVNGSGQTQWQSAVFAGINPIAATQILSSATVNGTLRTTTATGLSWYGDVKY